MGRNYVDLDNRKMPLSVSVPYPIWARAKEHGSKRIVDLIMLGDWAKKNNISQLTLETLKRNYEEKIMKLQNIIDNGCK